ncbi:transferase, LIC12162 family protein [Leptospira sp. 201903070]|uniref:Transferase, LIC12162 family protein n=1 Tax=Leptospira ainlahdjerensis TaxID=2810033 RepID=A0ABS2UAA8_9LEPT|nr:LIC12162 family protein [Leptospira ainlahdjerensis]MBM9577312.1 transferase, LIC12162 family protein [Leptospira ainlahdjerensis]
MVKRTLIATALEETWPSFETPVIFLGEWCKIYNRKHIWEHFDSQTHPYHWDNREKFKNDYYQLESLYEEILLPEVAKNLNRIHGIDQDLQYWRILIGPWLGYFTHILFDRYEVVQGVVRDSDSDNLTVFEFFNFNPEEITPNDSADFFSLHITDYWNQYIYQKVIEEISPQTKENQDDIPKIDRAHQRGLEKTFFSSFRERAKNLFYSIMSYGISDKESFFIGDYLPWKISFLLQLRLGTIPRKRRFENLPRFQNRSEDRSKWVVSSSSSKFESFVKRMIPLQIPKVFIEGFASLQKELKNKKWPSKPKLIFTSNSHVDNDLFKLFAAEKRKHGTPLILSQHGGFYGIGAFSFLEEHETSISDAYLTWGWTKSGKTNLFPIGCTKLASTRMVKARHQDGNAVLVLNGIPRYSYYMYSIPQSSQHRFYLEDQWNFVDSLSEDIRKKLTVRFYPQDYGWCQDERWRECFPTLDYMEKGSDLEKVLNRFRIYISTYNATTYLESFYKNIPTIIYWNPKYWEIREEAKPYFQSLEKVGIFHPNPKEASKFLTQQWDRIDLWWNQEDVQNARMEFLNRYCKKIDNPVFTLSNELNLLSEKKR